MLTLKTLGAVTKTVKENERSTMSRVYGRGSGWLVYGGRPARSGREGHGPRPSHCCCVYGSGSAVCECYWRLNDAVLLRRGLW